jgi:hypothetical protein
VAHFCGFHPILSDNMSANPGHSIDLNYFRVTFDLRQGRVAGASLTARIEAFLDAAQ